MESFGVWLGMKMLLSVTQTGNTSFDNLYGEANRGDTCGSINYRTEQYQ